MPLRKIVTGDSSQMSKTNSKKFVYVNQQNAKKTRLEKILWLWSWNLFVRGSIQLFILGRGAIKFESFHREPISERLVSHNLQVKFLGFQYTVLEI